MRTKSEGIIYHKFDFRTKELAVLSNADWEEKKKIKRFKTAKGVAVY